MQYTIISALIAATAFVSASPMPQVGAFASQSVPLAINLNKGFNSLSAASPCNPATQANACVKGAFAQCVNGNFIIGAGCGALRCFALPLVNSVGASVTCDTPEDAAARMGFASVAELNVAIGGGAVAVPVAGDAPVATPAPVTTPAVTPPTAPPTAPAGSIVSQSIPLAIAQNASFKTLSANSPCNPAKQANACIKGAFAQCVNGKFVVGAGCSGTLKCFALPLVNSVGTSVTCDTPEDAAARMGISVGQL